MSIIENQQTLCPDNVLQLLNSEMGINLDHFLLKYGSFDSVFQNEANHLLSAMLCDIKKIIQDNLPLDTFNIHYHETGNENQDEFIQAMFNCFKLLPEYSGLALQQAIYAHTNRGGENWFPIVIITDQVTDNSDLDEELTLYRGCSTDEFNSKEYRQSWTTRLDVACIFAFQHFHNLDLNNRVVIKAKINKSDIAWNREIEGEMVLIPNTTPLLDEVELTYQQYLRASNQYSNSTGSSKN